MKNEGLVNLSEITPEGIINWIRRPTKVYMLVFTDLSARNNLPLLIFYKITDAMAYIKTNPFTESEWTDLKRFKISDRDRERISAINAGQPPYHHYKLITKWSKGRSSTSNTLYLIEIPTTQLDAPPFS